MFAQQVTARVSLPAFLLGLVVFGLTAKASAQAQPKRDWDKKDARGRLAQLNAKRFFKPGAQVEFGPRIIYDGGNGVALRFVYSGGEFRRIALGRWAEFQGGKKIFEFREVGERSDRYRLTLYDAARNTTVVIDHARFYLAGSSPFYEKAGRWVR